MICKDKKTQFNIEEIDMSILSAAQKFSFAKIYDGQSEVLLQKLIDDDSALDIPTGKDDEIVKVSILAVLLENKNIKDELKKKLIDACADSQDEEVKVRLAKDKDTPLYIQKKLVHDKNNDIVVELVWRKLPYPSILKQIAKNENWAVRREVSKSLFTDLDTLESFINETDDEVVLEVIQNKNTTPELLNKFAEKFFSQDGWFNPAGDKYDMLSNLKFLKALVDRVFSSNATTEELEQSFILSSIAQHDEEHYRLILAKPSPYSIPSNIYKMLYKKGDEFTPTYLSDSNVLGERILREMAEDKNTSPIILMNLSNRKFSSVKVAVASNPNTLDLIVKKLTFDKSKEVRKAARDTLTKREQAKKSKDISDDLADR